MSIGKSLFRGRYHRCVSPLIRSLFRPQTYISNRSDSATPTSHSVFFFLSVFVELGLIRHRKKEKAFGPSPNNGYTAGSPRRKFWQRKPKNRDAEFAAEKPDALPAHQTPADFRTSYATESTAVGGQEPVYNKYGAGMRI